MEMRIASTARADLDDMGDAGLGHARMSARMGWAGACAITYACALDRGERREAPPGRRTSVADSRRRTLGALDVPGWLGAVSPDRTPPRAPERVREVVLRTRALSHLNVESDLSGLGALIAESLPAPRSHALGEQLGNTDANAAC
jgi:hypothetical protein